MTERKRLRLSLNIPCGVFRSLRELKLLLKPAVLDTFLEARARPSSLGPRTREVETLVDSED